MESSIKEILEKKKLSIKNIRCRIHFFSKPKGLYASNATENGTQQKLFLEWV